MTVDASGWHPDGMGGCEPQAVLSAEFGPATWALDPVFAAPTADTTELHILVWERSCSGGSPATGRISAPVIQSTSTTLTITIGVRPLQVPEGFGLSLPDAARDPGDPDASCAARNADAPRRRNRAAGATLAGERLTMLGQ